MGADRAQRIAVLLQSLEGGGAQRRTVDLVNGFVAAGRAVDLLLVEGHGGDLSDRVASGVKVIPLAAPAATSLAAYIQREKPDALLAAAAAVHGVAVDAVARAPVPLILRASSHPSRAFPWSLLRQRLTEPSRRRARLKRYAAADLVIAVADDVADAIRAVLPEAKITVVRNPVITSDFLAGATRTIDDPWPGEPPAPLILGVGRLAMAKDFPTLIRAFALLRAARPARLVILGDGSVREREALVQLARRLGVERDLALPGPTDAIAAWFKAASLFVLSSLWEGAPGALIEAMAMGCPVVATDRVGTARALLHDGRLGALVPARDPPAMAAAMARQLDHPAGPAELAAAVADYRAGGQAADYLAAIDRCVRAGRR